MGGGAPPAPPGPSLTLGMTSNRNGQLQRSAAILHDIAVTLQPGFRFGPYEILSRLGAGGMGEVYHARDSKLRRDVALKVLPQDSPAGIERLRRFEQEARAASQLNHPNIVTIYD